MAPAISIKNVSVGGPHSAPPPPIINIVGWKIKLVHKWKGGLSKFGCGSLTAVQLYFSTCMIVATHALRCSCDQRPRPCQYDTFPRGKAAVRKSFLVITIILCLTQRSYTVAVAYQNCCYYM